jgi:hypothetical protein
MGPQHTPPVVRVHHQARSVATVVLPSVQGPRGAPDAPDAAAKDCLPSRRNIVPSLQHPRFAPSPCVFIAPFPSRRHRPPAAAASRCRQPLPPAAASSGARPPRLSGSRLRLAFSSLLPPPAVAAASRSIVQLDSAPHQPGHLAPQRFAPRLAFSSGFHGPVSAASRPAPATRRNTRPSQPASQPAVRASRFAPAPCVFIAPLHPVFNSTTCTTRASPHPCPALAARASRLRFQSAVPASAAPPLLPRA